MIPEPAQAALVRGIGAYLRSADQNEVPPHLRRFRSFRPAALTKHKSEVLGALDLAPTRGLILQWLEEAKPPLSKADAAALRAAAEAGEDWRKSLEVEAPVGEQSAPSQAALQRLRDELEREKARVVKAREGERAARDKLSQASKEAAAKEAGQSREIGLLQRRLEQLEAEVQSYRAASAKAADERTGERRRAERALEKERRARQEAETGLKRARRELRSAEAQAREQAGKGRATPQGETELVAPSDQQKAPFRRRPLKAPTGRLDDDPESLSSWLATDKVQLLVDGYNVSKSETGFGNLSLEGQRERVVHSVNALARRHSLKPIVVFDGSLEAASATLRRARGPAIVEYSAGENADDHLIARLQSLPADPVIVVTNDRELQARAAALGATIATSGQLLALAR